MTLKLKPEALAQEILIPTSKSYANRLLIVAARLGAGRRILNVPTSDDVVFLIECFKQIGLELDVIENGYSFKNCFPECEHTNAQPLDLHVGEGGTTARFLLSLLSLGKRKYILSMEGRLSQRPWLGLIEILQSAGVQIAWINDHQLTIQGPVDLSRLPQEVSCHETTQFITSLQLSFFKEGFQFKPMDLDASEAYWKMTLDCAKDFTERTIPQDWSSAAYPMVLAAIRSESVLFKGLVRDSLQADCAILDLLKARGGAEEVAAGIKVSKLKIATPLMIDGSKCLDLIPALAVLALRLKGESVILNTQGLVAKESNRLEEIVRILSAAGAKISVDQNFSLRITGPHNTHELHLDPVADHRMVMMSAILMLSNQGGLVENNQSVSKSFPNFFEIVAPTSK